MTTSIISYLILRYGFGMDDPETFMKSMAQKSNKFFLPIPVPAFMMKLIMGEMSSIILKGSRASNEKIKSTGFTFKYPDLNAALDDLINK